MLCLMGKTYSEIEEITGRTQKTICGYVKKFREEGLPGLVMKYSTGRPSKISKEQELKIHETITNSTPEIEDEEFIARNWNITVICRWIKKKYGITYSRSGMWYLLRRLGFSFTVPTYVLAKADPIAQEAFKEAFEELKTQLLNDEIDHILFVDESSIRDYQAIQKCWFPKGQQRKIKTYGKHWGAKLIGSLDYESGEVFCIQRESYTAKEFLVFLKLIALKYKNKRVVMIVDNAKIHRAHLIQPFLEEHKDTLTLFYLPPYSPQLNLIEGLWGWLKKSVINNVFFNSDKEIHTAVHGFIDYINETPEVTVDRLCVRL